MATTKDKDTSPADNDQAAPAPAAAGGRKVELITVKSGLKRRPDGGDPVALWEQHEDHPKKKPGDLLGEVYVAGDKPVEVAKTPLVRKRLSEGALVEA